MIVFMALAAGTSTMHCGPLTLHTNTAIHFCEKIIGAKFTVTEDEGKKGRYLVTCVGVGLKNKYIP